MALLRFALGLAGALAGGRCAWAQDIVPEHALVIGGVARAGRSAVHTDAIEAQIVAGTWHTPADGHSVRLPSGEARTWKALDATSPGFFEDRALAGGYALVPIELPEPRVMLLEASGHGMVYVNGEPREGDPYDKGMVRLPVSLPKGHSELLFNCGRG